MSQPAQKAKASPSRRKKKPLLYLVDDQPLLLDLAEVSLKDGKYTIKKFTDPEKALQAFLKARPKPDLLITDYAMGKVNGLELIEKCKEAHPHLKTVLLSGTAGYEVVVASPVKVDRFVGKPYQPASLAELVRRMLSPDAQSSTEAKP
jgi:DNA-binding NtrC family response regulator